ncbi:MAG: diaminopimelate epimerase [Candidatus Nanopelagicales bacterium]
MSPRETTFVKGHGTGNDFVVITNLEGEVDVTPSLVRALCDRRRGIGGDGVLVVARTADHPEVSDQAEMAPYFMDYRNADGSLAQMCGNGARVFAAHLVATQLAGAGSFQIATRGGPRRVVVDPSVGQVVVDMGPAMFLEGTDITVRTGQGGSETGRPAVGVLMPNPHAVTWVDAVADAGDLREKPIVAPADVFPDGVNSEFVELVTDLHIRMRVFERGVGETLSCGTGACAAAVATLRRQGVAADGQRVRVDVPGGTVAVLWRADGGVELSGPAEFVARGTVDRDWWQRHG